MKSASRLRAALAAFVILCVLGGPLAAAGIFCASRGADAPSGALSVMMAEPPSDLSVGRPGGALLQSFRAAPASAPFPRQSAGKAISCRIPAPACVITAPAAAALEMAGGAGMRSLLRCVMDKDGKK